MLARLRSLWRVLTFRRDFEAAMSEELHFHMEEHTQELVRSGLPYGEATRQARMAFSGINTVKDECRAARGVLRFDELLRQLRYAARWLRKTPGFTATALLTLALCFGANLTIFAFIDSVLLRPLPFPQSNRLVTIFNTYPKAGVERDGSSLTNYYERRGRIPAFGSVAIYRLGTAIVGELGYTRREPVTQVSPEFFSTLGSGPATGTGFTEQQTNFGTHNVAIVSDAYWRQHLNADPHVLGRNVRVDGFPKTVIGVLPPAFHFLSSEAVIYLPLASDPQDRAPSQRHSGGNVTQMIARLKPGFTIAQAQAQIDAQNASLEKDDPQGKLMADAGFRSLVASLHDNHVRSIRPMLLLLQAAVLLLLLVGSVNLGNLLLVRSASRMREVAVRQALGASRAHLLSEALTETVLLTLVGGLLGLLLAGGGIRMLTALGADRLPLGSHIAFDARLAAVGIGMAIVLGIVLAVPGAWFSLRRGLNEGLKSETRSGTAGRSAQTLRHSFVVAQLALAFVLLSGAGMLSLSLFRVMAIYPGFQAEHVLSARVSLVGDKYPSPQSGLLFVETLMDKLEHQAGVTTAGVVTNIPFSGNSGKSAAHVKGYVLRAGQSPRGHYSYGVGGDYFRAMGFSLREGRFLTEADSRRKERLCVVDEDFARNYWPNISALGHQLWAGSDAGSETEAFTVVGVVGSAKQAGLTGDVGQGAVYYPYIYRADNNIFIAARADRGTNSLALTLQKVVRQIDPALAVDDVRSMDDRISESLISRRSPALLATVFSALALLLLAIGTYGVLSYTVAQRHREIGVRIALGARPDQIRGQFISLVLRLLLAGTLLGAAGAWLTGRAMQTVLFDVRVLDWPILAGGIVLIAAVSLGACFPAIRRATRVSPLEARADN